MLEVAGSSRIPMLVSLLVLLAMINPRRVEEGYKEASHAVTKAL
jgi:hypothetical protein